MEVRIEKVTSFDDMKEVAEQTVRFSCKKLNPKAMYVSEHSPSRTQLFKIFLSDVPVAYSTHFVRHHIGVDHYCLSQRPDRGGDGDFVTTRLSPTSHLMWINAQSLINISRFRMCFHAHEIARSIMKEIHTKIREIDPDLAFAMRPNCYYHGGVCMEHKMCGRMKGVVHWKDSPWFNYQW